MVNKKDVRAMIEAIIDHKGSFSKEDALGIINYHVGGVTQDDSHRVRRC